VCGGKKRGAECLVFQKVFEPSSAEVRIKRIDAISGHSLKD
jgi:hypothetical protein